jgi:calcineurin-like phosphoesterase family protein
MENVWFTADTHYYHERILTLGKGRPFDSVEEMNDAMMERWNDRVQKQDRVYHLGDISFGSYVYTEMIMQGLRGQIHIIKGNHDNDAMLKKLANSVKGIQSVERYREINVGGKKVVLFHFPILDWNRRYQGSWHLHGHTHGNLEIENGSMLDVGVDCQDFAPIDFDQVTELLQDKPFIPRAHHTEERA